MSLQHVAQHLADKGRGPDTELIHMTKGEVAGLQKLAEAHGGSLTVNPHTGLPEAGFLESILPAVVGGATAFFAPWALPYVAGGLGALTWDKTGDPVKGIAAGLGAYGAGSFVGGLGSLGAGEAASAVGQSAAAAGENAAQQAFTTAGPQMIGADLEQMGAAEAAKANLLSPDVLAQSAREYAADTYVPTAAQQAALANPVSTGLGSALSNPSKLMDVMGGPKGIATTAALAGAPLLSKALGFGQTNMGGPKVAPETTAADYQRYSYSPGVASPFPQANPQGVGQNYFPGQGYNKISQAEAKALYGYAGGGDVQGNVMDTQGDPNLQQVPTYDPVVRMASGAAVKDKRHKAKGLSDEEGLYGAAGLSDMPGLYDAQGLYDSEGLYAAGGGISDLGGYSDGGRLLKGPGDGVSDSIPAQIGAKQPARLADGEFVVPARIVSELGNGSTDAGARQLYKMMDRVQQARSKTTGKSKVAKNTNAAKYLPA